MEHCKNPWKPNCNSEDIKLYIQIKAENLPVCKTCWLQLAESDHEWGPDTQTTL